MPLWYLIEALHTVFHRVTKPVLAPVTYLSKDPYQDIQPSSIFHSSPESHSPLVHWTGAQESCQGLTCPSFRDLQWAERLGSSSLS